VALHHTEHFNTAFCTVLRFSGTGPAGAGAVGGIRSLAQAGVAVFTRTHAAATITALVLLRLGWLHAPASATGAASRSLEAASEPALLLVRDIHSNTCHARLVMTHAAPCLGQPPLTNILLCDHGIAGDTGPTGATGRCPCPNSPSLLLQSLPAVVLWIILTRAVYTQQAWTLGGKCRWHDCPTNATLCT